MEYNHCAPTVDQNDQRSKSDFVLDDSIDASEDLENLNDDQEVEAKKDDGWLSRIVPEFEFPDLFKPVQLQIPILTFPKLPSYSISIAR